SARASTLRVTTELERGSAVRLDRGDCDVEYREPTLLLDDVHLKLDACEFLVIRITTFDDGIASESDLNLRLDAFDDMLHVNGSRERVIVERRIGDNVLLAARGINRGVAIRSGGFQESMWGEPDVERTGLRTAICVLVLDDVARNRAYASLTGGRIKW